MGKQPTFQEANISCIEEFHWCVYADGFFRAAEILVDNLRSTYEVNAVVFPIIFLYRQYLELSFKEIIAYGRFLDESQHGTPQSHDLKGLWNEAKACINKHIENVDKNEVKKIEGVVLKMHALDPTSEASRYPIVKKRQYADKTAAFSQGPTHINLHELAERMRIVSTFFNNATSILSVSQDLAAEYRNDNSVLEW